MQATYANDVAAYNKLTLPHPLRSRLTTGGRVNENDQAAASLCTTGHYVVAHHGGPMVMGLVKQPDGWKVE